MNRSRLSGGYAFVLAFCFLAAPAVIMLNETTAHASSSVGGMINRTEVLQRAQYWVDQGFTYVEAALPISPSPNLHFVRSIVCRV